MNIIVSNSKKTNNGKGGIPGDRSLGNSVGLKTGFFNFVKDFSSLPSSAKLAGGDKEYSLKRRLYMHHSYDLFQYFEFGLYICKKKRGLGNPTRTYMTLK